MISLWCHQGRTHVIFIIFKSALYRTNCNGVLKFRSLENTSSVSLNSTNELNVHHLATQTPNSRQYMLTINTNNNHLSKTVFIQLSDRFQNQCVSWWLPLDEVLVPGMRRLLDALVDRSSLQNETELIHGNLNRRGYFSAGFWKFF